MLLKRLLKLSCSTKLAYNYLAHYKNREYFVGGEECFFFINLSAVVKEEFSIFKSANAAGGLSDMGKSEFLHTVLAL